MPDSPERFDSWESYFYPETFNAGWGIGVLRNKWGLRNAMELSVRETRASLARTLQLRAGLVEIPHTYDASHMRAIHHHLFQDAYEWAGEYRTVTMGKNASNFAAPADIDRYLEIVRDSVQDSPWRSMNRSEFAGAMAHTYAYVNTAHPFREGNGRSAKQFLVDVSELSHFRLDFDPDRTGVTPEIWNQRAGLSTPDRGAFAPDPSVLVDVFDAMATPHPDGPSHELAAAVDLNPEHNLDALLRSITDGMGRHRGDEQAPQLDTPPPPIDHPTPEGYER